MRTSNALPSIILAVLGIFLGISAQAQRTATAIPTVANGFIIAVTVTDGGTGYTNAPLVTISGGGGSGAVAVATVLNGAVDKIIVKNAGSDYTGTPAVTIDAPPSPKPPFSDGLIAYYPFNGNADDQSGNSFNGTVVGATLTSDRFGMTNRAFHFTQSSDHMVVPIDFNNSQNVTISAWVKFDTQNKGQSLFNRMGVFHGIALGYTPEGALSFFVGGAQGYAMASYQTTLVINSWHLYIGTYDGKTVKLFYDGILVASRVSTGDILYTETWPSWIGNYSPGPLLPLQGTIDDTRIYNRALSDQEVEDLYYYEAPEQPFLKIDVKTVKVSMTVKPTKKYQLMSSLDLKTWTNVGAVFMATTSEVVQEFDITTTGRYFRLFEVP
jgi:hypothetical protein